MKNIICLVILSSLFACGKNKIETIKDENKGPRSPQRAALIQDEKNLIMDCDVHNTTDVFYITEERSEYKAYILSEGQKREFSYLNTQTDIKLENAFNIFYNDLNHQYFESNDSLNIDDKSFKVVITHTDRDTSMVNAVEIKPNFSIEIIENLFHLSKCEHKTLDY